MKAWLNIDGGDNGLRRAFHRQCDDAGLHDGALAHPWLISIGAIRRPLSLPGIASAPTANMEVALDNANGQITRLWAERPPLRAAAAIATPDGAIFNGTVTSVQLGETAALDLQAGLDRPLSDLLPLRKTTVWGGYKDLRTLPWGYGAITLTPIQYSDDQRVFLLLDHPIQGVDRVMRDDVATDAWAWQNAVDSTGHACSFLELAEPLAEGERLAVTLRGRMHPDSGRLLVSPAEILWDVLANLAGAPVSWSDLDSYRTESADIVLGGLLDDGQATIRATLDSIVQSAGGAWSAGMPGVAITWPPLPDETAPALKADKLRARGLTATAAHDNIFTVLRVLYDYDHAAGKHRRAIQLEAPAAVREYGVLENEWDAGWLRSPRQAEALGRRMLAWLARPRWRIGWRQNFADVATGAWADLDHPHAPVQGRHRLLNAELDLSAPSLSCTVEAPVGQAPEIVTTQLSTTFEPLIPAGITVEIAQDEIIFTARGDDGRPLAGAKITLDGNLTRIADNAGRVSFPVTRGRHVLLIEAQGYPASETVVTI